MEKGRSLVYPMHLGFLFFPQQGPAVTGEPSLSQYRAGPNSPCLLNQTFSRGRPLASPGPASLSSGFKQPIAHPCAAGSDLSCSKQERG